MLNNKLSCYIIFCLLMHSLMIFPGKFWQLFPFIFPVLDELHYCKTLDIHIDISLYFASFMITR